MEQRDEASRQPPPIRREPLDVERQHRHRNADADHDHEYAGEKHEQVLIDHATTSHLLVEPPDELR